MKKGQTALEYLITYGWAILVILVVTAVLWYYGVFNPSKWTGDQVSGFSIFQVSTGSYAISTTGANFLATKIADKVNVTGITFSGDCTGSAAYPEVASSTYRQILAGGTANFTIQTLACAGLGAGDTAQLTVGIAYDDITTGLVGATDTGSMQIKLA